MNFMGGTGNNNPQGQSRPEDAAPKAPQGWGGGAVHPQAFQQQLGRQGATAWAANPQTQKNPWGNMPLNGESQAAPVGQLGALQGGGFGGFNPQAANSVDISGRPKVEGQQWNDQGGVGTGTFYPTPVHPSVPIGMPSGPFGPRNGPGNTGPLPPGFPGGPGGFPHGGPISMDGNPNGIGMMPPRMPNGGQGYDGTNMGTVNSFDPVGPGPKTGGFYPTTPQNTGPMAPQQPAGWNWNRNQQMY